MIRIGNLIRRFLICLGCGQASQADELSPLATETLQNPNLEGEYTTRDRPEIRIPKDWEEWHTNRTFFPGPIKRAESEPSSRLTHSGKTGLKQHMVHVLWHGGIWQRIAVTKGEWYRFSGWVWVYASNRDGNVSEGGELHAMLGINPWGNWPDTYSTVWGKECEKWNEDEGYDKWVHLEVIAQAFKSEISVCTRGLVHYTAKHNDVYWDDFKFEHVDWGSPPPEPSPEPPPAGECGFVNKWAEVLDNQAELLQELARVPKKGDTVTL